MKFVHSFWSKPLLESKFNDYSTLLNVVLTDYAYSVACIKKNGHSIKLFTDKIGAQLLSFIPYDEIVVLDIPKNWNVHFAAQIKFEALKRMSLDECLIDGDLFLRYPAAYERISSIGADFVYSFFEPTSFTLNTQAQIDKYVHMRDQMRTYRSSFKAPYEIDKDIYKDYEWTNTSLMLFHNQKLKDEYIRQYDYYRRLLKNINFKNAWPDIIIEQRHMTKLLATGYSSEPVIADFPSHFANEYAIHIGYTHLGSAKINLHHIVKDWLKVLDSDLFNAVQEQTVKYLSQKFA